MRQVAPVWIYAAYASALCGCAQVAGDSEDKSEPTLRIAAASGFRDVARERLLPRFAAIWQSESGRRPRFEESYGSAGSVTRSIGSGFEADVALLMSAGDIQQLATSNIVPHTGSSSPAGRIIARGKVVIGVRPGNPKQILEWDDLARADVGVILADPRTSGGSRWNVFAIWGSGRLGTGGSEAAARDLLARIVVRVVTFESSSRLSLAAFARGAGDAIVTAENELQMLRARTGVAYETIVPSATLRMDLPATVIEASIARHQNRALAEAFLAFLRGPEGQAAFREFGFMPLVDPAEKSARVDSKPSDAKLFTIEELGGWTRLDRDLFGPGGVWDKLFVDAAKRGPTAR